MESLRALRLAALHVCDEVHGLKADAARLDQVSEHLLGEVERMVAEVADRILVIEQRRHDRIPQG